MVWLQSVKTLAPADASTALPHHESPGTGSGFTSSRKRFIHAELGEQGGQQIAVLRGVASPGNILHEDILGSDFSHQEVATLIFYFTDVNFCILDRFFKQYLERCNSIFIL